MRVCDNPRLNPNAVKLGVDQLVGCFNEHRFYLILHAFPCSGTCSNKSDTCAGLKLQDLTMGITCDMQCSRYYHSLTKAEYLKHINGSVGKQNK